MSFDEFVTSPAAFLPFWLQQKPVVIENVPVINHNAILNALSNLKGHRMGVKLSPTRDFEGIDKLQNWAMSSSQYVPREVLDQMQSPDLVVVRAAHKELNISDIFAIFAHSTLLAEKRQRTQASSSRSRNPSPDPNPNLTMDNDINAYVEYLPVSRRPNDVLKILLEQLLPGLDDAEQLQQHSTLSNSLPKWLDDYLLDGKAHVWIGDGRAVGKLHFDPFDNILVQVEGSKTFLLADASQNERFLEGHMREAELEIDLRSFQDDKNENVITATFFKNKLSESTSMVHSPIGSLRAVVALNDPDDISSQETKMRFPEVNNIEGTLMECHVDAGSALFVPSFWWHEVQSHPGDHLQFTANAGAHNGSGRDSLAANISLNVAVNFWFSPLFSKEFPCATCRKEFNKEYRKSIEAVVEYIESNGVTIAQK